MSKNAIVVGAGITGLTASFRLQQQGWTVRVLESADHVGGKTAALRRDGFTINRGATVFPASYVTLRTLAEDIGFGPELQPIAASLKVLRGNETHELRVSGTGAMVDALRTRLISSRAKLQMRHLALDALKVRREMSYTDHQARARVDGESVGQYCARRFGQEAHDWAIDPLTRGLWVVDADPISSVDLFFALVKMFGPGMLSYPAGMDFACRELAQRVPVTLGAHVESVVPSGDGVRVRWQENGTARDETADGCVVAVVASAAADLLPEADDRVRAILTSELAYTDTITASFAVSRKPAGGQLATVLPAREDPGLAIVPLTHISSPDCAPAGKGVVAGYWTSEWSSPRMELDDDELMKEILPAMERVVPGLRADTEFVNLERWSLSTLKSRPGVHHTIAELVARLDAGSAIQLAGDYFGPPNLESCVISAEAAARHLIARTAGAPATVGLATG